MEGTATSPSPTEDGVLAVDEVAGLVRIDRESVYAVVSRGELAGGDRSASCARSLVSGPSPTAGDGCRASTFDSEAAINSMIEIVATQRIETVTVTWSILGGRDQGSNVHGRDRVVRRDAP